MVEQTPEQIRVRHHAGAVSPAIESLRAVLTSGKAAEDEFWAWQANPETQMFIRAIEELADNPPVRAADTPTTLLLQYGMTSGLQLALKLLTNPRRVFPELFRDPQTQSQEPLSSYVDTADQVLDRL